ncbi:MAG: DNA modification methylase [Deltaproteobacteria bacterium]|nr:DNA modification methylase [Deltaproteobacteria bacterium]
MDIQTVEIDRIKPATYNPRKDLQPGDPEYVKLKKSILEFDMVEPLVWNKQTGNLVGGHQRLKILKEMGVKSIEVSVVDLDEVKEKALNLALNKISGEWDYPSLKDLLEELDTGAFDIEITGFDTKEIEELMTQFHEPEPGLTDDDAVPEPTQLICRRGDLWQLGNHRLLCGDATVKTDVDRLMGGEKADMVFTDPPYGIDLDTDWSTVKPKKQKGKIDFNKVGGGGFYDKIIGDAKPFDAAFILAAFDYCKEIFLWGADYYCKQLPVGAWLIWDKKESESADEIFGSCFEVLWSRQKHKRYMIRKQWSGIFGLASQDTKKRVHPTQKPIEVLVWVLGKYSKLSGKIVDLFGGSGSTLIACEKLGRRCYMMEIDEHYCDVIIKRWEDYTGKEAVCI